MPLKKGKSRETISKNIEEFHDSDTYAATKRKSGKKAADKQAVAVALNTARESGAKLPRKKSAKKATKKKAAKKTVKKTAKKTVKKSAKKATRKSSGKAAKKSAKKARK